VTTEPRRCAIVSDKQHGGSGTTGKMEGRGLVAITDRAQENREYVRTLLRNKQPEFAALLEWLERELPCLRCRDTICGSWPVNGVGEDGERGHGRRGPATEFVRC
jgi:hypothetical protein